MSKRAYIVLHTDTGAMDGVYFDRDLADRMLDHWREMEPGRWLLVEVLKTSGGHPGIPDHLFAAKVFGIRT